MKNKDVVIINGQRYDGTTGRPIEKVPEKLANVTNHTHINTKPLQNIAKKSLKSGVTLARKVGRTMDIARSKSISHFGTRTTPNTPAQTAGSSTKNIISPKHPLIAKTETKRQLSKPSTIKSVSSKTAKARKEEVIAEALKNSASETTPDKKTMKRGLKISILAFVSILVIIISGYLFYLFMPNLSVKVASAQAGINATFPEYCPDGYSLSGPVKYNGDMVTINFHSKTDDSEFVIKQSKSGLDSSAVKIKAEKEADSEVITTSERGLTIFTYKDNAMWANGGILYTISGNAPLSSDQIRRIATSL